MISCSENNLDHLHTNLTWTMKCAEQALKDDSHIILATKSNSQMKAGCNVDRGAADGGLACMSSSVDTKYQRFPSSDEDVGTIYFNYLNRDWINTVGECGAAIVADVSRSGATYTMKYRYIFKDIYEWATHYDTTGNFNLEPSYSFEPGALHWFHEVGAAEEYLMRGEFEGELTWTAGQTAFEEGIFEAVKQTVQNRVSAKAWLEGNEYDRFEQAIEANPRTPENGQEAYERIQKKFIF